MSPLFSFLLCLIAQFCQISFLLPLSKIFILLILRYIVSHLFSFMSFPFVVICSFKLFVTCLFPVIFIHMSKIIVLQKIKRGLHSLVKNDLGLGKGLGRDVMCGIKQFVCRILCRAKLHHLSSLIRAHSTQHHAHQQAGGEWPPGRVYVLNRDSFISAFPFR